MSVGLHNKTVDDPLLTVIEEDAEAAAEDLIVTMEWLMYVDRWWYSIFNHYYSLHDENKNQSYKRRSNIVQTLSNNSYSLM